MRWSVATTKPFQERRAADNLDRQGLEPYLPEILRHSRSGQPKRELLFPRYIFVRVDRSTSGLVANTKGISRLIVDADGYPVPMPDREIAGLKARELNGFIRLTSRFKRGDEVIVTGSDYRAGLTGVYEEMDSMSRCKVLITMLGRPVPTILHEGDLAALPA